MSFWHVITIRLFAWYFRKVPFSPALEPALRRASAPIVVTPDDALLWQGLLAALAKAVGIQKITRVSSSPSDGALEAAGTDSETTLRWVNLHDAAALERLLDPHQPYQVATLNVFQLRGPVKEPPQHRPGFWWKVGMILTRRVMTVIVGNPLDPREALRQGTGPRAVSRLRRLLKLDFNRNLKLVRGVPVQPLSEQARVILSGNDFDRELRILSERTGATFSRTRQGAERAFYELAANQRRSMYTVLAFLARVIISRLFTSVRTEGLERLKEAIKGHAVVLVPMHRSHLDYIILQYKLYEAAINPPHVAAGINLSFWPAGPLIRSVGAYFVKRNARDRLHMLVLRRYVTYLMQRGHSQMFFIEGGRSRSGKMMRPKTGLLGVLFDAYRKGIRKEILFVPVALSYEQVIEDQEFGSENTGRSKTKENLVSTFHALDIFKRSYGEVLISFGEPLSLSQFMRERQSAPGGSASAVPNTMPNAPSRSDEREALKDFGLTLVRSIRRYISPSLSNLAYTALMLSPQYGLSRSHLAETIRNLALIVAIHQREFSGVGPLTPALERFLEGRETILNDLPREGVIERARCVTEDVFYVPGKRRFTADFYRNGVLHLFLPLSIFSCLELMGEPLTGERAALFHGIFESELLLLPRALFAEECELFATQLLKHGILSESEGDRAFATHARGHFIPRLLEAPLESVLWVWQNLAALSTHGIGGSGDEKEVSYQRFVQQLQNDFTVARYAGRVHRTEAASLTAISAVLEVLVDRRVIEIEEKAGSKHRIVLQPSAITEEIQREFSFYERAHRAIQRWTPHGEHQS